MPRCHAPRGGEYGTMEYLDSTSSLETVKKILKVNHAGEFGAINVYRAQILVARISNPKLVPLFAAIGEKDESRSI